MTEVPKIRRKLVIKKLYCKETEDSTGPDECYLKVHPGMYSDMHRIPQRGEHQLNNGQTWYINWEKILEVGTTSSSEYECSVELWDADPDWLDPDDLLGRETHIDLRWATQDKTLNFCKDDADYYLTYRIEEIP